MLKLTKRFSVRWRYTNEKRPIIDFHNNLEKSPSFFLPQSNLHARFKRSNFGLGFSSRNSRVDFFENF